MSTVERVKLADGKYCYSGPNCQWHSPNGAKTASKKVVEAEQNVLKAKTFEDFQKAKENLGNAYLNYDASDVGKKELEQKISNLTNKKGDVLEIAALKERLDRAKAQERFIEIEQQKMWEKQSDPNRLIISNDHTYKPANFTSDNPDDMYSSVQGEKYSGYTDVKVIAKNIRGDLKEAQQKNYLPNHLKFSVNIERFSGGSAIRVTVHGLTDKQITPHKDEIPEDPNDFYAKRRQYELSAEAAELRTRVKNITDAYNSMSSHPEIDYFDHSYYSSVELEDEQMAKFREEEKHKSKQRAEFNKSKKNYVQQISAAGGLENFLKNKKIDMHVDETKDFIYGKIDGTKTYALISQSYLPESSTNPKRTILLDLESSDKNEQEIEQYLKSNPLNKVYRGLRNYSITE